MVVYEKICLEVHMTNTFDTKIILHNDILYSSYIGIFPVDLGMPLIFTDFQ